jgi:hypothetical protein
MSDETPFWSSRVGLAVLVLLSALYTARLGLNWDAAIYLLGARALAEGRVLYQTFPDYSFPANMWLAMFSLQLSQWIGVVPAPVHAVVLFALQASATWLAARQLDAVLTPRSLARAMLAPVLFWLFFVYPVSEAGQRDLLFGIGVAPMVAIAVRRAVGQAPSRGTVLLAGAMAVAGASLKPHFIAALALLALCDAAARGGLSRVWLADWAPIGGGAAAYLLVVVGLYPVYFTEVLPTATHSYAGYAPPVAELVRNFAGNAVIAVVAAAALGAVFWKRRRDGAPWPWRLAAAWVGVVVVLSLLYFSQRQGFGYHRREVGLFCLATLGLSALALVDLPRVRTWAPAAVAAMLVVAAVWRSTAEPHQLKIAELMADPMTRLLRSLPPRTPILALETGVSAVSPIVSYADVRWTGEHGSLVELRAIVSDRDAAAETGRPRDPVLVRLEADVRARMLASFAPLVPEVVLVDTAPAPRLRWFESYTKPFTILGFYEEDPAFVAMFSAYERRESITSWGGMPYDVYELKAGSPALRR